MGYTPHLKKFQNQDIHTVHVYIEKQWCEWPLKLFFLQPPNMLESQYTQNGSLEHLHLGFA